MCAASHLVFNKNHVACSIHIQHHQENVISMFHFTDTGATNHLCYE